MGVLRFKHIFFRSFVGPNGASQVVFIFLLIPCCFTKELRALPFLPNVSFFWGWNAPTEACPKKFNVPLDLSLFHYIGYPTKDAIGQPITLFYVDRLGYYPYIEKNGHKKHGGVPQAGDLQAHLTKAKTDIELYMPTDYLGLAVIDWEEWRPVWARNWKPKDIYRNESILLVQQQNSKLTLAEASNIAKVNYETAGMNFMLGTLKLAQHLRPSTLWGYYLFPDCYNHHYTKPNYDGACFDIEKKRNDELNWLWNGSTALFPSIYLNSFLSDSPYTAPFVRNRIKEGLRVALVQNKDKPLPVFIYARPVFTDNSSRFLTQDDLIHTFGETVSLGASGILVWGSLNLSQSEDTCRKLHNYMDTTLNPYIINITLAAKICSRVLCQDKGVCTRKDFDSSDYLHLNPKHFLIKNMNNGTFEVKGRINVEDLQQFVDHFQCGCYPSMNCETKVNLAQKILIDICIMDGICIKSIINSENEIFHSSASLVLFLLFLIVLENEYSGMQTTL